MLKPHGGTIINRIAKDKEKADEIKKMLKEISKKKEN